jgi:hypothetical protein
MFSLFDFCKKVVTLNWGSVKKLVYCYSIILTIIGTFGHVFDYTINKFTYDCANRAVCIGGYFGYLFGTLLGAAVVSVVVVLPVFLISIMYCFFTKRFLGFFNQATHIMYCYLILGRLGQFIIVARAYYLS